MITLKTTILKIALLLPLLFIPDGCASVTGPQADAEEDVRESVYRYLFQTNSSGLFYEGQIDTSLKVFFLAYATLDNQYRTPARYYDPPLLFFARFHESPRPVKPFTHLGTDRFEELYNALTNQHGILFYTGGIELQSGSRASAEGGYSVGWQCAAGETFYLHLDNKTWVVDSVVHRWIS